MGEVYEYDEYRIPEYPMDCYRDEVNCTISCVNFTIVGNCTYVYEDQHVSFWQIPQLVILIFLFVFIVFGNTCVLVAIGLSESGRKTRMNFFIMNLAIADLSVGIFHVTIDIAEKCLVTWHGGPVFCKIIRYFQVFVVYASTFMIVSLSIDRVDAIARPMNFTRKAVTVRALVYAAWILSGVLSIPSFLLFDTAKRNDETFCYITKFDQAWHWQTYITLIAMTAFVIPALVIVACYTIIICVIWDKGRGFSNTFNAKSSRSPSMFDDVEMHNMLEPEVRQHTDRGNKGIIPQAKIRTFKMTLIIVGAFVLSWCPYFVFNLMDVYAGQTSKSETQQAVTTLINSLAPLNSAANPIIYGAFSTRICNNLRRVPCVAVLCRWFFKCRTSRRNSSIRGPNASHTDQTLVDAGSGKQKRHVSANGRRLFYDYETSNLLGQNKNSHHHNGCKKPNQCIYKLNDNCGKRISKPKGFQSRRPSGLPLVNRKMTLQDTIILETYRVSTESGTLVNNSFVRQNSSTSEETSHVSQNTFDTNGLLAESKTNTIVRSDNGPISEEPSNYIL